MNPENENYKGKITVTFDGLPPVKLVSIKLDPKTSWFMRIAESTRRRFFTLEQDWQITLNGICYQKELNGTVIIPKHEQGNLVVYDGASIPLPWFVSFLTMGILRPLGAMLVASIVHDFAYGFGYLNVTGADGATRKVAISRQHADRLFRDMLQTINQTFPVGWVAWFAVRLGWIFGVKYAGTPGRSKRMRVAAVTGLIGLGALLVLFISFTQMATYLEHALLFVAGGYFVFYVATVIALTFRTDPTPAESEQHPNEVIVPKIVSPDSLDPEPTDPPPPPPPPPP